MLNEEKIVEMMKQKVWAVVGASSNTKKISNKIYHTFNKHGYETFAINPNCEQMDNGEKCYSSLEDLPKVPECIDFVVPPAIAMKYLEEMDPKVYPNIWLQPGTYNEEVVNYAESKGFTVVQEGACAMAYLRMNG